MNVTNYHDLREINYSPELCRIDEEGNCFFTNPLAFLHGSDLVVPDRVKMPDGTVNELVWFDKGLLAYSFWHNTNTIRMIVGGVIEQLVDDFNNGWYTVAEFNEKLQFPGLSDIEFFDEGNQIGLTTSKHGILYNDNEVIFVPCSNQYVRRLSPDSLEQQILEKSLITEIKDPFGGVYSLDGTKFLRWEGSNRIDSYSVLPGVKEIANSGFYRCTGIGNGEHGLSIYEIKLPDSIEKIGEKAFWASSIKKIVLPNSLISIGPRAFGWCCGLDTIEIPDSVEDIGDSAFVISSLKEIKIGKKVRYIGNSCFYNCYYLASIDVNPQNEFFSSVEGALFDKLYKTLITVPTGKIRTKDDPEPAIEYEKPIIAEESGTIQFKNMIEGVSFKHFLDTSSFNQKDLQYPKLPLYETISNGTSEAPLIEIKYDVACVVDECGDICENLTIRPPHGTRVFLEDGAHFQEGEIICQYPSFDFYTLNPKYAQRLHFKIPESVEIIESSAFSRCTLEELIIPDTVKLLKCGCFELCSTSLFAIGKNTRFEQDGELGMSASKIIIDPDNPNYTLIDGVMFDKDCRNLILCPTEKEELDIPFGVETIYPYAFSRCKLRRLTMPPSLTVLFRNAFSGSDIKEITLSPNLCEIGNDAFSIYNDYIKINIPSSLHDRVRHKPIYSGRYGNGYIDEQIIDALDEENRSYTLNIEDLPEEDGSRYIPVGSWRYFNNLQDSNSEDSDSEECEFIEISRAKILSHLEQLKNYFTNIALQKQGVIFHYYPVFNSGCSDYASASIKFSDGNILRFVKNDDIETNITDAGNILRFLGLEIDEYLQTQERCIRFDKSSEYFKNIIGKILCHHIYFTWKEDFVDENTGEVETYDYKALRARRGEIISQELFDSICSDKDIDHVYVCENDRYGYLESSILDIDSFYNGISESTELLYWNISQCDFSVLEQTDTQDMIPVIDKYLCPGLRDGEWTELYKTNLKSDYLHIVEQLCKYYPSEDTIDFQILTESKVDISTSEKDQELALSISEFFDERITKLKQCQNEEDAFGLFLIDEDLLIELRTYLSKKGLPYQFIF